MSSLRCKELRNRISDFLAFKRALGLKYKYGETVLRRFVIFALRRSLRRSRIDLEEAIHAWLDGRPPCNPVTLSYELSVLRQFCLYLRRSNPSAYVPPVRLLPQTDSHYIPYLFSLEQIRQLIGAAGTEHWPRSTFWPETLRMLLIVMYCTGLRPGEAVGIQMRDINQDRRVLHIRESKGRTRDLPYRPDLAREFTRYLRRRATLLRGCSHEREPALFVDLKGHAITYDAALVAIRRLLQRLGMKSQRGRIGPRPYDVRHAFAVHRLTAWYYDGVDLEARLPWLSAYMGHVNLLGTETYLHATPELFDMASKRFARVFAESGEPR